MARGYPVRLSVFDGTSATSSTYTGGPYLVQDAATIAVSIATSNTASSLFTLQASNDGGIQAAIINWSAVTTITAQGFYTIDPGARWHRWLKSSLDSAVTINQTMWMT